MCPPGHLTNSKNIQIDHIIQTVPLTGWDGFDKFIERLWCPAEGLQCLCKTHHDEKTSAEREVRKMYRKNKKEKL